MKQSSFFLLLLFPRLTGCALFCLSMQALFSSIGRQLLPKACHLAVSCVFFVESWLVWFHSFCCSSLGIVLRYSGLHSCSEWKVIGLWSLPSSCCSTCHQAILATSCSEVGCVRVIWFKSSTSSPFRSRFGYRQLVWLLKSQTIIRLNSVEINHFHWL